MTQDATAAPRARPLSLVAADRLAAWKTTRDAAELAWLGAAGFDGKPGDLALLPPRGPDDGGGGAVFVFAQDGSTEDFWRLAGLPTRLPDAPWRLAGQHPPAVATRIATAWGIGSYAFARYRKAARAAARLETPVGADAAAVARDVEANRFVRDLINTPAQDMGPGELAAAALEMAAEFGMQARVVTGADLLAEGHRLIHAVGRASARAPRLIDLTWGDPAHPRITLVGKGVCFDTGGLDLKGADGMKLMKKDMGGAAHVLGLARMAMRAALPLRLRVLVAAVENAVSGDAFRPLDIVTSRKGITVEIGNTDAEGRLILADALDLACEDKPALVIDMATLTGAARVALGPELPAAFCNDEDVAVALARHAVAQADPVWRLPLWKPYRALLDSKTADINNVGSGPMAGSITAALFMQEFVAPGIPWLHLDVYAWNASARPGRPEGAEAQALRALFGLLHERAVSSIGGGVLS
jgi:leucyl aminopeptidase